MLTRYRLWTAGVQLSFAGRVEAEDEVSLGIPDSRQANRKQPQAETSGAARTSSGDARIPKYVEGIAASTDGPRANWPRRAAGRLRSISPKPEHPISRLETSLCVLVSIRMKLAYAPPAFAGDGRPTDYGPLGHPDGAGAHLSGRSRRARDRRTARLACAERSADIV